MNAEQHQKASDLLWSGWHEGRKLSALPEAMRPSTREDGYAIQALLERHTSMPLFGWKIAATSQAGQAHIGVDGPIAGRLLGEQTQHSDTSMPLMGNAMELDAIAAVVIGGASLFGGRGSIIGTLIGVLIMVMIRNGLNLMGVSPFWQGSAIGCRHVAEVLAGEMTEPAIAHAAARGAS